MKYILTMSIIAGVMLTAGLFFASTPAHAMSSEGLDYCQGGPQAFDVGYDEQALCYIVKPGDTLWGIAEKYLGSGFKWSKLNVRSEFRRTQSVERFVGDPRTLQSGTFVVIHAGMMNAAPGFVGVTGTPHVDYKTGNLITEQRKRSKKTNFESHILVGDNVVAGPFAFVFRPRITPDLKHITYRATKLSDASKCRMQFYFDHVPNPHVTCGSDFGLLSVSTDGSNYAARNNKGTDPEEFVVLSSIGNGDYFDYSDSLEWVDEETLVYRAQINDQWRVVVNHEDFAVFDYIESLEVENGVIKFSARHEDGSWSQEMIDMDTK